ncbi:MAG TPA: NAD(P)-binding domain-containing protein, partial [Sphingobacteriaceae bacterium]
MRIALLGSGNVATHLGRALAIAGEEIIQVWSRNQANAESLARELHAVAVSDPSGITTEADLYILSVNDDAILSVASRLPVHDRIVVHTSGSTGMEVLQHAS